MVMSPRKVEISPHVHFVPVEGDYVLMDFKKGLYLGLDPVASTIWRSLVEHGDMERAAKDVCQDYDVTYETALADIERWVAELETRGLLRLPEPRETGVTLFDEGDLR
ncbi:MAG: hypothetical protein DMF53_07930 [Acidobacteria bacterium]|nr:MAG: hypothetical protein DMF53_07930 [Acidobacteriota bacterium]